MIIWALCICSVVGVKPTWLPWMPVGCSWSTVGAAGAGTVAAVCAPGTTTGARGVLLSAAAAIARGGGAGAVWVAASTGADRPVMNTSRAPAAIALDFGGAAASALIR